MLQIYGKSITGYVWATEDFLFFIEGDNIITEKEGG